MSTFLQNDFQEKRWSDAAMKNAYSLMRKMQYDTAVGLFLLPGTKFVSEAVRLCISRLNDPSLALVISRLVDFRATSQEPSNDLQTEFFGNTLKFVKGHLLPAFESASSRWLMASGATWVGDTSALKEALSQVKDRRASNFANITDVALMPIAFYTNKKLSSVNELQKLHDTIAYWLFRYEMFDWATAFSAQAIKITNEISSTSTESSNSQWMTFTAKLIEHKLLAYADRQVNEMAAQKNPCENYLKSIADSTTKLACEVKQILKGCSAPACLEEAIFQRMFIHCRHNVVAYALLLALVKRQESLEEWIQYTSLNAISSFGSIRRLNASFYLARCRITVQLLYLKLLWARGIVVLTNGTAGLVDAAIRIGLLVMAWNEDKSQVRFIISDQAPVATSSASIRVGLQDRWIALHQRFVALYSSAELYNIENSTQYKFTPVMHNASDATMALCIDDIVNVAMYEEDISFTLEEVYTLVLRMQMLRTFYCGLQILLKQFQHDVDALHSENAGIDMDVNAVVARSSCIYGGLWYLRTQNPVRGLKEWYTSLDMALSTALRQMCTPKPCTCLPIGLHTQGKMKIKYQGPYESVEEKDNILYHMMQNAGTKLPLLTRGFRADPRVHVVCFSFEQIAHWLLRGGYFHTREAVKGFVDRLCNASRIRLIVQKGEPYNRRRHHHTTNSKIHETISDGAELYMFVSPWEVDAKGSLRRYMHNGLRVPILDLGWDSFHGVSLNKISSENPRSSDVHQGDLFFISKDIKELWNIVRGEECFISTISELNNSDCYPIQHNGHRSAYYSELYCMLQKNSLFQLLGYSYRFISYIEVSRLIFRKNAQHH